MLEEGRAGAEIVNSRHASPPITQLYIRLKVPFTSGKSLHISSFILGQKLSRVMRLALKFPFFVRQG